MNDELDALRAFRPETAGPTDAHRRTERTAFMETLAHAPASTPHGFTRVRRRRGIVLAVAVALVAAVGTAGAAGLIPGDVQQALGLAAAQPADPELAPLVDQAVQRASATTADGGTLELWTAPTTGGGSCAYLRTLDAAGMPADSGPTSCAVSLAGGGVAGSFSWRRTGSPQPGGVTMSIGGPLGTGRLAVQLQLDGTGAGEVYGQAGDGVAQVQVVGADGGVRATGAVTNGWFVLPLTAAAASSVASLVTLSASGATVATLPVRVPPAPAP